MLQRRKTKFCASDGRPPGPCRTVYEGRKGRRGRVRGRLAGWKYQVGLGACAAVTHRANAACAAGSAEDPPANANVHGYDERPPPPSGGVTDGKVRETIRLPSPCTPSASAAAASEGHCQCSLTSSMHVAVAVLTATATSASPNHAPCYVLAPTPRQHAPVPPPGTNINRHRHAARRTHGDTPNSATQRRGDSSLGAQRACTLTVQCTCARCVWWYRRTGSPRTPARIDKPPSPSIRASWHSRAVKLWAAHGPCRWTCRRVPVSTRASCPA